MRQKMIETMLGRYLGDNGFSRRGEMIRHFFGVSDHSLKTMSEIASDMGVSREAVRQAINDFGDYAQDSAYLPSLRKLVPQGLSFTLDEKEASSNEMPAQLSYRIRRYIFQSETVREKTVSKRLYFIFDRDIDIKSLQSSCVKKISRNGAVNLDVVAKEFFPDVDPRVAIEFILATLKLKDSCAQCVSSPSGAYAFLPKVGRNRLLERIRKLFYHFESIPLDRVIPALERDMRRRGNQVTEIPPSDVVYRMCEVVGASIEDGVMYAQVAPESNLTSSDYEIAIADFVEASNGQSREKAIENHVKVKDSDAYGFSVAIMHSPLVYRVSRGVYELTGKRRK